MKKTCISILISATLLIVGCGGSTLPAISPQSVNFPVVSAIGDKVGDSYGFSWLNPDNSTGSWKPANKTLLVFWIYGCSQCLPEIVAVEDFSKKSKLDIVVVNMNKIKDLPLLSDMVSQLDEPLTIKMVLDPTSELGGKYGVSTVPDAMIVDGYGKILVRQKARVDLDTLLEMEKKMEAK
jgi:hypothetical protein